MNQTISFSLSFLFVIIRHFVVIQTWQLLLKNFVILSRYDFLELGFVKRAFDDHKILLRMVNWWANILVSQQKMIGSQCFLVIIIQTEWTQGSYIQFFFNITHCLWKNALDEWSLPQNMLSCNFWTTNTKGFQSVVLRVYWTYNYFLAEFYVMRVPSFFNPRRSPPTFVQLQQTWSRCCRLFYLICFFVRAKKAKLHQKNYLRSNRVPLPSAPLSELDNWTDNNIAYQCFGQSSQWKGQSSRLQHLQRLMKNPTTGLVDLPLAVLSFMLCHFFR